MGLKKILKEETRTMYHSYPLIEPIIDIKLIPKIHTFEANPISTEPTDFRLSGFFLMNLLSVNSSIILKNKRFISGLFSRT
jgi:hypothetical protein